MASGQHVDATGYVESRTLQGGRLTISGWMASAGAGRLRRLEVSAFGARCTPVHEAYGLASPDVGLARPELSDGAHSRYIVHFALPAPWATRTANVPLFIRPFFDQGPGKPQGVLHQSSLPVPPDSFVALIGSDLEGVSVEFLEHFVNEAGLGRMANVLDVGCGMGRMTYALAGFLDASAHYEGFDIIPSLVQWAQKNISPVLPNFRFSEAPIYNSFYSPGGHLKPTDFIFPYAPATFDFALLTSVFTHMEGPEIRHYLREIRRVLRPGGRCLITCFLLNSDSRGLIRQGKSALDISVPRGDSMIADPKNPEYAVGFDEEVLRSWFQSAGLTVSKALYGNWCGRERFVSFQDMLVVHG